MKKVKAPHSSQDLVSLFEVVEHAKYVWESTFDAMIHPVLIIDKNYKIQRANLALAQVSGRDVRTLIGKTCYEVFAGKKSPCKGCPLPSLLQESLQEKKTSCSRLERFSDQREYEATSFRLQGKHNDLDLYIVQYRDIREEKTLQAKLLQSEKMAAVGILAGGIAHEINNPLSAVLAFTELALGAAPRGSQLEEDLKEIKTSALRCKKIVENVLEFSRPSSEEKREIELKEAFYRVFPLLKLQAKQAKAELKVQIEEDLPKIFANSNHLEQIFLNLNSNACHAVLPGGEVRISATLQDPQWIRIDFADNGVGIKKEDLSKIFDPFFTTKKTGVGTGLGLSILYSLIKDHGGRIEVESIEKGGSCFKIFLPVFLGQKENEEFFSGLPSGSLREGKESHIAEA